MFGETATQRPVFLNIFSTTTQAMCALQGSLLPLLARNLLSSQKLLLTPVDPSQQRQCRHRGSHSWLVLPCPSLHTRRGMGGWTHFPSSLFVFSWIAHPLFRKWNWELPIGSFLPIVFSPSKGSGQKSQYHFFLSFFLFFFCFLLSF